MVAQVDCTHLTMSIPSGRASHGDVATPLSDDASDASWLAMLRPSSSHPHPRESRLVGLLLAAKLGVLSTSAGRKQVLHQLKDTSRSVLQAQEDDQSQKKELADDPEVDASALRWLRAPLKSTQPGAIQAACAVLAALLQEEEAAACAWEVGLTPLIVDACLYREQSSANETAEQKKKDEDAWRALRHVLEHVERMHSMEHNQPWDATPVEMHAFLDWDVECKVWKASVAAVEDNADARWVMRKMARTHVMREDASLGKGQEYLRDVLDKLLDLNFQFSSLEKGDTNARSHEKGKEADVSEGEKKMEEYARSKEEIEDCRVTLDAVLAMPVCQKIILDRAVSKEGKRWNSQARKHVTAILRTRQRGNAGTHALRVASTCLQILGPQWILEEEEESTASALMLYLVENARIEAHVAAQSELRLKDSHKENIVEVPATSVGAKFGALGLESKHEIDQMELMCLACSLMEFCIDVLVLDQGSVLAPVTSRAISTAGRFADDMAEYLEESFANGWSNAYMQVSAARSLARILAEVPSSAKTALKLLLAPAVDTMERPANTEKSRPKGQCQIPADDVLDLSSTTAKPRDRRSFLSFLLSLRESQEDKTPAVAFFLPWMLLCASDAEWDGGQAFALVRAGVIEAVVGALVENDVDHDLQDNICKVGTLCIMTSDELESCRRTVSQQVIQPTRGTATPKQTGAESTMADCLHGCEQDGLLWTKTDPDEDGRKEQFRKDACGAALPKAAALLGRATSPFVVAFCAAVLSEAREHSKNIHNISYLTKQLQKKCSWQEKMESAEQSLARTISNYYWNRLNAPKAMEETSTP